MTPQPTSIEPKRSLPLRSGDTATGVPSRAMLYKLRSAEYGLLALKERRLKVATLDSLNDPYESIPFRRVDPRVRQRLEQLRSGVWTERGMVSFSWSFANPILWSHYAANHTGLCLGFGVPTDHKPPRNILPVRYIGRPLRVEDYDWDDATALPSTDDARLRLAIDMLFTKYSHWRYEAEVRLLVPLGERDGKHFFEPFGPDLRLYKVIIGADSGITEDMVQDALSGYQHAADVSISYAQLADTRFRVVERRFAGFRPFEPLSNDR